MFKAAFLLPEAEAENMTSTVQEAEAASVPVQVSLCIAKEEASLPPRLTSEIDMLSVPEFFNVKV